MAAMPVDLHPDAVDEARAARLWYAERNKSTTARFQAALDHAIAEVADAPDRWAPYLHGTRRAANSAVFRTGSCTTCGTNGSSWWRASTAADGPGIGANESGDHGDWLTVNESGL
jgi:hypothetical protein